MSEVTDLRKSGKLKEAWLLAAKNLAERPNDIWAARDFAWVAYDCMKRYTDKDSNYFGNMDAYVISLAKARALPLGDDDAMFFENAAKNVRFVVWELAKSDEKGLPDLRKLLDEIIQWDPRSPLIIEGTVRGFLKGLKSDPDATVKLMRWWGLDKFEREDFERRDAGGRTMMSFAEEATHRYLKALSAKDQYGGLKYDEDYLSDVVDTVKALLSDSRCEDWEWPTKSLGGLLNDMGRDDEASYFLAPVVLAKPKEAWAWHAFAGSLKRRNPESYAKCLFRGLAVSRDTKMSLPLHEESMQFFSNHGLRTLAKAEASMIDECRRDNGWSALESASRTLADSMDVVASTQEDLRTAYVANSQGAELCLSEYAPKTELYLEWADTKKGRAGIVLLEEKRAQFTWQRSREHALVRKAVSTDIPSAELERSVGEVFDGILDNKQRILIALFPHSSESAIRKRVQRETVGVLDLNVKDESKRICFVRVSAGDDRNDDIYVAPRTAEGLDELAGKVVTACERLVFRKEKGKDGTVDKKAGEDWVWEIASIEAAETSVASSVMDGSRVQFYVDRIIDDNGLVSIGMLKTQKPSHGIYSSFRPRVELESGLLNIRYTEPELSEHHVYECAVFGKTRLVAIGEANEVASGDLWQSTIKPSVSGIYEVSNGWGHIGCEEYASVPPKTVQEYSIESGSMVQARLYKTFLKDKKRSEGVRPVQQKAGGHWEWHAESIEVLSPPDEREVDGTISVAVGGFGFLESENGISSFISAESIHEYHLQNGDQVRAIIRQSWNRKRKENSWIVTSVLSIYNYSSNTQDNPEKQPDGVQ